MLRERINLDGLSVELVDTAGLREDPDQIEAEGIRRAAAAMREADAALWIVDASRAEHAKRPAALPADLPVIRVKNKIDLCLTEPEPGDDVLVSAMTGAGMDSLKQAIRALAGVRASDEGTFSARQRHIDALERAQEHFQAGVQALDESRSGELLAEELRLSLEALGDIRGEFLERRTCWGRIFSEFCIGK